MKAYAILDIDIHDPKGYSKYPPLTLSLMEKNGGRITLRVSQFEAVEGDWSPKRVLIARFPDKSAARAFLDDPDCQPLKQLRLKTATSLMVIRKSEI